MNRESRVFRGASAVLAIVVAHFLCGGTQWARAARADEQAGSRRAAQAKMLGLPVALLENPAGFGRSEAVQAVVRRAAGLERLKQYTASPKQALQRVRVANFVTAIEGNTRSARLSAATSKAKALALSLDATKAALESIAPGFSRAAQGPKSPKVQPASFREREKPAPAKPAAPRTEWPKQGTLTPSLLELYASAVGTNARAVLPDGSEVAVTEMAATPTRKETRLASLMSDFGLMLPLLGVLPPPAAEDTAETPETRRSPPIAALVQSTGRDALKLYNAVLTKIRPELYAGSKKGADATLREGAGNDFDTASLLVALLREAGIPARYEYGTVSLTLGQAEALTGAKTVLGAAQLLGAIGVPNAVSSDGTKLVMERAWVRAYVPYGDRRYGSAASPGESLWVRLDAGLKLQRWTAAANLKGVASFSQAAYLAAPNSKSPQAVYEAQLLAAARAQNLCNTLDEALYAGALTQPALTLLPAEHPGQVLASLLSFARPPPSMRWSVAVGLGSLAASFELSELEYRTLALRYVGATPADEAALTAAGDITNVVPYQVRVVPVLRLDGQEKARGAPVLVGTQQALTVRTTVPQGSPRAFSHRLVAGAVYGLSLSGGVTTDEWAAQRRRAMTGLAVGSPEAIEATAHAVQALYSHRSQTSARRVASLTGHVVVLDAFESLAGRQLLVTEVNGLPISVRWGLYFIDANDSMTPVPRDGNPSQVENLSQLFGLHGSYLESQAWEEVFSRQALSTVTIIHAARSQAIPVDTFTSGAVTGLSGYSASALAEMNEAVSAGWKVTAPRRPVSFGGYLDAEGYILLNPLVGTGSYKVSFELNGGGSSGPGAPGGSSCPACAGPNQPVNSIVDMAAAEWRESWVDLTLPGVGLPLVFSRTYASRAEVGSTLGPRWMHSFATALREESNGDVTWIQEDLRTARFSLTSPGVWTPQAGYFQRLQPRAGGGYSLIEKNGFIREFDGSGRLARLLDTSGNAVTCVYLGPGPLLSEVRDASNQLAFSFSYVDGALTRVTDRAGRRVEFRHAGGNLTGFTDALGHTEVYGYDDGHRLTAMTDVRGFTRHEFYDAAGRWAGGRDALGHERRLLHDSVARRAVYFDAVGAPTVYEWGPAGEQLATIDAVGNERRVVRDAAFLPTSQTDARGQTTGMTYDSRGNVLTVTHPDGRSEGFTYEATFNRVLTHSQTGLPSVTNTYDTAGRLKTRADGVGTTTYGYDARGQLETVTAPGNAVQRFGYDGNGNMTSVTDATGRTITMGYDTAGHVTSSTDNAGKTRTMVVDALGRLQSIRDELNRVTSFTRDEAGLALTTTDALLHASSMTYDALGRASSSTDASGATRRTEYDAEGRVVATVDALGKRTTRSYDAVGRLVSSTDAAGFTSTVGYCADVGQACAEVDALGHVRVRDFDAAGRVKTETDEVGRVTTHVYDAGGRRFKESGPMQPPTEYRYLGNGLLDSVTSPVLSINYQYDVRGNRSFVRALNSSGVQTTAYTYDDANRLLTETNPLNQVTRFTYDGRGNRETKVDGKLATTTYGYDDARRLSDVTFADGTAYAFRFDELGRRVSEASSTHLRTFVYDAVGRVATVTDGLTGAVVTSGYDAEGRRTLVSEGGVDRRFEYDSRGLLRRLRMGTGGWFNVTRDVLGRRTSVTRPNGVRSDWVYDEAGQLSAVLHTKGGAVVEGFSYTYDSHGLRVSKTRFDGTSEMYGYDGADRLVRVDESSGRSSQYTLDFVGNRTGLVVAQGAQVTSTNSTSNAFNQLTSSNRNGGGLPSLGTAYAYDNNGNLTSETAGTAATTYTWDADNRLRQVTQPSLLSNYEYDANGLRTKKVEAGVETRFLLDGSSVLAEFDSGNVARRRYLQNPESIDDVYVFSESGQTYFPLTDALGSVVAITDTAGSVVRRNSYDVYGARSSIGTGPDWAFGFTGREQDGSGLNYNRDRYLDSMSGRWGQPDRLDVEDEYNRYAYVKGEPTGATDPSGQMRLPNSIEARILVLLGQGAAGWRQAIEYLRILTDRIQPGLALQRALDTLTRARPIAGTCEGIARQLHSAFSQAGLHARFVEVTSSGRGYIVARNLPDNASAITQTGYHLAVRVGDRVFDAVTGTGGMTMQIYSTNFLSRANDVVVLTLEGAPIGF